MKVIVSHDVDHVTAWEHSKDLIIPKFMARAIIEWRLGYVSRSEVWKRIASLVTNQWNHIEALMDFDRAQGVPSTFFVAVGNGCNLSYGREDSRVWIREIARQGFSVGVHGIAYRSLEAIREEYCDFQESSGLSQCGIRMHYLRMAGDTLRNLDLAGYTYDSTENSLRDPYCVGNMWEFPLHLMDGQVLYGSARWQSRGLEDACRVTQARLEEAMNASIRYFSLLFHDRYFCDEYATWRDWYMWVVEYCRSIGIEFIGYDEAMVELRQGSV